MGRAAAVAAAATLMFAPPLAGMQGGAAGDPAKALTAWAATLPDDPEAAAELEAFTHRGTALDPGYRSALASNVREFVLESGEAALRRIATEGCQPGIVVTFGAAALEKGGSTGGAHVPAASSREGAAVRERFEEGLVRIEMTACLDPSLAASPEDALAQYVDPAFRMEVEGRIASIREEGAMSCVVTRGVPGLLGAGDACNRIDRLVRPGEVAAEYSRVVSNRTGAGLQPVYLKSSLKTFVRTPDGGLALHYINVSRTADLSRLERWVGERQIRSGEEAKVRALEGALQRER